MSFPVNDENYREGILEIAKEVGGGYEIALKGDFGCLLLEKPISIIPRVGMTARYYSDYRYGFIRGVFIDGIKVYYYTKDEYKLKNIEDSYGKNAADMLKKWDEGKSVWTVSVGGIGPGYEQAIQVTMFEVLRYLIDLNCTESEFNNSWNEIYKAIDNRVTPIVSKLRLSGAQWHAAVRLATQFYRYAPGIFFQEGLKKERLILVNKSWPCLEA